MKSKKRVILLIQVSRKSVVMFNCDHLNILPKGKTLRTTYLLGIFLFFPFALPVLAFLNISSNTSEIALVMTKRWKDRVTDRKPY